MVRWSIRSTTTLLKLQLIARSSTVYCWRWVMSLKMILAGIAVLRAIMLGVQFHRPILMWQIVLVSYKSFCFVASGHLRVRGILASMIQKFKITTAFYKFSFVANYKLFLIVGFSRQYSCEDKHCREHVNIIPHYPTTIPLALLVCHLRRGPFGRTEWLCP